VTVFGFPSSATTYILQEFSIYGQILRYVVSPFILLMLRNPYAIGVIEYFNCLTKPSNGGNWMHIQYLTKLHAQKALSKNGKILANSIMIAVLPCIDKVR
jgi:nuclear pore complex protein Nup53